MWFVFKYFICYWGGEEKKSIILTLLVNTERLHPSEFFNNVLQDSLIIVFNYGYISPSEELKKKKK